ncbi:hypothetical protein SAMN05518672_10486 [Chitinophaga sp. CF118]|nr:hypothetical protein SAMN05518672_10486 [Chitinophaga sp. CF118]
MVNIKREILLFFRAGYFKAYAIVLIHCFAVGYKKLLSHKNYGIPYIYESTSIFRKSISYAFRGSGTLICQRSFNALLAAWKPHMPCTPPPGGVEEEHK